MPAATLKIEATTAPLMRCPRHVTIWFRTEGCPVCKINAEIAKLRERLKAKEAQA